MPRLAASRSDPILDNLPPLAEKNGDCVLPERRRTLESLKVVTQNAARSLGFDLKFNSTPNWTTYERLLRMGKTYLDRLRPLGAVEGGGLRLLREKQKDNNYRFWTERDETTMSELLDDDDLVGEGDLFSRSARVDSLDEAFREWDRSPWRRFYPIEVHPDLRVEVLREVRRKGGDTEEKRGKAALKEI